MTSTPSKRQPIPFGRYLLLDRINIGGMAEVWRGKSFGAGGFERLVAIKRILPNIAEDEEFIHMFIDEAKISSQLTHANIAQIYELGQIASSYFIAMEYIPGRDLRAIFDRCRKRNESAPVALTCFVVSKMCEGLDYAHRKKDGMGRDLNIVHRDISPQNILISYEGEVKVIDFGIAKAANKATKTQAGILKGKFGYMSPEQIRGLNVDRRSDVFAIGVCLHEMLTGERLFVGDSDFAVLEKVRKAEVTPPSQINPRVPEALDKIVLKALAKDVEQRYAYASELGDDLQRFLLSSDSIFSRKDLLQYMRATFAEDVEKERIRIQDYADIRAPEEMLAALDSGFSASAMEPPRKATPAHGAPPLTAGKTVAAPVRPPVVEPSAPRAAAGSGAGPIRRAPSLTSLPKAAPQPAAQPPPAAHLFGADDEPSEGAATTLIDPAELGLRPEELLRPAGAKPAAGAPTGIPSAQFARVGDDEEGAYDKTSVPASMLQEPPRHSPTLTAPPGRRPAAFDPAPIATSVQRPRATTSLPVQTPIQSEADNDSTDPNRGFSAAGLEDAKTDRARDAVARKTAPQGAVDAPSDVADDSTNPERTVSPDALVEPQAPLSELVAATDPEVTVAPPPRQTSSRPSREAAGAASRNAEAPPRARDFKPAPVVETTTSSRPTPQQLLSDLLQNRARAVIAGAIGLGVLIVFFALLSALSGGSTGYVLISLEPHPAQGAIKVNVGGVDVVPESWPHLQEVKAGQMFVVVAAEGYEPAAQSVDVVEGKDPTSVTVPLKKAGAPPSQARDSQ